MLVTEFVELGSLYRLLHNPTCYRPLDYATKVVDVFCATIANATLVEIGFGYC